METESIYTLVDAREQGCGKENGDLMLSGDSFSESSTDGSYLSGANELEE